MKKVIVALLVLTFLVCLTLPFLQVNPVYATSNTWEVTTSSDDCFRITGDGNTFDKTGDYLYVADSSTSWYDYSSGMRFNSITIPKGSTINSAYLTLMARPTATVFPTTYIEGQASDNATTFSDANDYDARPRTSANVAWTPTAWQTDVFYNSTDIKTVIQEIIDRAGWASGNSLVLFWRDAAGWGGTYNKLSTTARDYGIVDNPHLTVTWTPPADTTPPTYSNIGHNTTLAGKPCKFSCKWTDNVGLSGFKFGTNNTGTWINDTWTDPWTGTPTSGWANVTKTLKSTPIPSIIGYRWYCNDTSNNWNNTGIKTLTTTYSAPPQYSNIAHNTTISNSICKFSCYWTDDQALSGYKFGTNNTGSWMNNTWVSLSGTASWANATKTLNSNVEVRVEYRWWCNDSQGQWSNTGIRYLITTTTETCYLTIIKPQNTTYTTSTIPVEITATGGTIDKKWFNCKNGTSWIYGSNQTYTVPTSMTGFVNGSSYTFYGWANNTDGNMDEETIMFTVAIPSSPPPSNTGTVNLYFPATTKLAFQHLDIPYVTSGATITLTVTSGTLNGTSGTFAMYPTSGRLTFTSQEAGTITLTSTSNSTNFHINGVVADSASIINGQNYVIEWSFLEPVFLLPIMFILGMFGLGSMFAGPIYGIYKVKHGEYFDGFRTGLVVTVLGVALMIAWLWSGA